MNGSTYDLVFKKLKPFLKPDLSEVQKHMIGDIIEKELGLENLKVVLGHIRNEADCLEGGDIIEHLDKLDFLLG